MKKRPNNSTRASALQITLSAALIMISAILLASIFKAAPAASDLRAPIAPPLQGDKDLAIAGPVAAPVPSAVDAFTFENTGSLNTSRTVHTATLLSNGKILVAGGEQSFPGGGFLSSAELYDPASGSWTATGSLNTARADHTATLLPNGKVLVVGGYNGGSNFNSAELYDPESGSWTATPPLSHTRREHTATLLPDGTVLVAGGLSGGSTTELYNPDTGTWRDTKNALNHQRFAHTATLLPDGKVLVAGGTGALTSAELYNPDTETWTDTGNLTARFRHTATLLPDGKVLVAGGLSGGSALRSAQLYNPDTGTWTDTGSLNAARFSLKATLLPNGKVLVAAGFDVDFLSSAELYDPDTETWTTTGSLNTARARHTTTLLPNGKVLVAGGDNGGGALTSAELYDSASGSWTATGSLNTGRFAHTATLLPNGKVLVAGGNNGGPMTSAELYDPASGNWTATDSLNTARTGHTATLLPNGKVLVAGGYNGGSNFNSAELYDPESGSWTATDSLNTARTGHTATLLPNGKVLVAGGYDGDVYLTSAELYDPESGSWTATGSLTTARSLHTATLLPNGKVLVAGGYDLGGALTSAELYDPESGSWTATGSLTTARSLHTATLLPNGKVIVAGGYSVESAELYDPASGTWAATGSLSTPRQWHTATLLPNGKVLVAGGDDGHQSVASTGSEFALSSAELYDPASGSWTATDSLNIARAGHTATLLPNGKVLLVGGGHDGKSAAQTSAELYDIGLGFVRPDWQPQITTATSPLALGSSLILTGSRFQGISQASGGSFQDSSTNYPVVQLRNIDNSQVAFLPVDPNPTPGWSDTTFTSTPVSDFPPGPSLVTVFTNGIPSDSKYVVVASSTPTPTPTATPTPTPTASATPSTVLGNISTRLRVETGDNALIGGFIVTGTQSKKIIVRAIGPSLPFGGVLVDPILELHDSSGDLIRSNDNWRSDQEQEIIDTGIPPSNDSESAVVATLPANGSAYTAIVRGVNDGTGVGLVEIYDLDHSVDSKLANIATRGLVQTGNDVMIAGTIVLGQAPQRVLVRAIGPSLPVDGALNDPTLELRDSNGTVIRSNDNWRSDQEKEIAATGIPPTNDLESALVETLSASGAAYTAIVRGVNETTGIALVEVYALTNLTVPTR